MSDWESTPDAPESLRMRVAVAMYRTDTGATAPDEALVEYAHEYLDLADAAIATVCTPVEQP